MGFSREISISGRNTKRPGRERLRTVLFVCSANLDRSPTAERLFQGWRRGWEAKSAGIMPALDRNPVTQTLIDWADLVLVMEPDHAEYIHGHFKCDPNKMRILDIGNKYVRGDPALIRELEEKALPILDMEDRLREIWGKEHSSRKQE